MAGEKHITPLKAIRQYCIQCKGVKKSMDCDNADCPLHQYHTGKTGSTRTLTDQQRAAIRERFEASKNKA